jgi:hypothetical protein
VLEIPRPQHPCRLSASHAAEHRQQRTQTSAFSDSVRRRERLRAAIEVRSRGARWIRVQPPMKRDASVLRTLLNLTSRNPAAPPSASAQSRLASDSHAADKPDSIPSENQRWRITWRAISLCDTANASSSSSAAALPTESRQVCRSRHKLPEPPVLNLAGAGANRCCVGGKGVDEGHSAAGVAHSLLQKVGAVPSSRSICSQSIRLRQLGAGHGVMRALPSLRHDVRACARRASDENKE